MKFMKWLLFFVTLFFILFPLPSSAKFFKNQDESDGLAQASVLMKD